MDEDDYDFDIEDDEFDYDDADEYDENDSEEDDLDEEDDALEEDLFEASMCGTIDAEMDARLGNGRYTSYGMSKSEDEMTEAEREAYSQGYESGFDAEAYRDD